MLNLWVIIYVTWISKKCFQSVFILVMIYSRSVAFSNISSYVGVFLCDELVNFFSIIIACLVMMMPDIYFLLGGGSTSGFLIIEIIFV